MRVTKSSVRNCKPAAASHLVREMERDRLNLHAYRQLPEAKQLGCAGQKEHLGTAATMAFQTRDRECGAIVLKIWSETVRHSEGEHLKTRT